MNAATATLRRGIGGRVLAGFLVCGLLFNLAGCPETAGSPVTPDENGGDVSDGGDTTNQNGNDGATGTTDTGASGTPVDPVKPTEISATANSIASVAGGVRNDPEGIAPADDVNRIAWKDSRGADRTMTLGAYLHQYDFSFDDNKQVVARTANDDAYGHPGFGYVVSHNTQNGNSPIGKANAPTKLETTVFRGGHHAIHHVELVYDRDKEGGGNGIRIPVVIEWLVATGRDHPVWAVTWKAGDISNPSNTDLNSYLMDVRGPYGSLNFDGAATRDAGDAIGGVAWGDFALKFTTTDAQLTLNSPWTYNTANTVAFTQAWTANVNAEMGIVQTRVSDLEMGYSDRVQDRERGATSADAFLDKGDCTGINDPRSYVVPCVTGWPYQLMNFDWDPTSGKPAGEATSTKLIAWGTPYGWLGASSFPLFDYSGTADGRGDRSYATFIVLGPRNRFNAVSGAFDQDGDVAVAIKSIEALAAAAVGEFKTGSVLTQVPRGPGALQEKTVANGYNDTYAAYYVRAAENHVAFTFTPAAGKPIKTPIFVVRNYLTTSIPSITLAGKPLAVNSGKADSDAFVSLNAAANELWVTLNRTLDAAAEVDIKGDSGGLVALSADQRRRADQFISIFENDTIEIQYAFAGNIADGRGYTAGRAGFTSATGDLLEVVERYTLIAPGNGLAAYLPRLRELAAAHDPSVVGLEGLPQAWAAAADDAAFRGVQDAVVNDEYFNPAVIRWRDTGLKTAVSLAELYDAIIQHGEGDDPDGLPAMMQRATIKAGGTPAMGVKEGVWLSSFLDVRRKTLEFATDPATRAGWAESVDRVDAMRKIFEDGNADLVGPIEVITPDHHATIP